MTTSLRSMAVEDSKSEMTLETIEMAIKILAAFSEPNRNINTMMILVETVADIAQ